MIYVSWKQTFRRKNGVYDTAVAAFFGEAAYFL